MKTIEVIVAPNGETKVETRGFTGESCQAASQFLESALGLKTAEQRTADFYRQSEVQPIQQVQ